MKLSVVIPVYNEKKRISATLEASITFFRENEPGFELIIVNDGSTDQTPDIIRTFAGTHPEVRIVSYEKNQGKGYAVREGMRSATGDLLLFMDADLATPLKEYLKLKEALTAQGLDMVIGSRVKEESDIEIHQPLYRRFVGRIFNLLVRTIALPGIKDSQCGFKMYTRKAYTLIAKEQTITDFSFDVEHLFIARKTGLGLKEIGVKWRNDANTTVSVTRAALPMLINLFRIRWRHL